MQKTYNTQENVKFDEDQGWLTAPGKRGTVILLHGSHASPINNELLATELAKLQYGIVSPLLKGHGLGGEYPTATSQELITQVQQCIEDVNKQENFCIVVGSSMGGTLALLAGVLDNPPDMIVSISGALSCRDIDHPWIRVLNELKTHLMSKMSEIQIPTLIFHDIDDNSVPYEDAQIAMRHCGSEQKKCILFSGSGHSLMFSNYAKQIALDIENFRNSLRKKKKITLEFFGEASEVYLAGEFNNWQPTLQFEKQNDRFVLQTRLLTGTYPYKIVVDGRWILDPKAATISTPNGEKNSRLVVD
ncbi:alpha/beta fold hydrolase [Candidatus Uabimicrobium amorphum]|uniref:Esterase n=1 Tax=Uabimicrobium amorphum TaxID=2596890 RepID=A0A5S9IHM5_UABAM|nr:alpha/beta fold hydrolase [Candidatus Uabimicrobium amorphum]BBM81747.1 esterase [Candidatus Uabimicrobium amorphum]